jgi:hypothetical protein
MRMDIRLWVGDSNPEPADQESDPEVPQGDL